ncbi:signal peptidase I [Halorhodospira halochloris]|uniref:Signal peptidase I n=1 Tax=Halorhodospira halochloris TaxID=1052 RepID=A0A125T2P7_HALHR|nr:signal peptidase I [Halorhodospira halochloris]MBK1652015.1 signal peptidase I [Halorhodospira halochloris]BAU58313.1 signal peptidase I [Halorhodospira halochloris]
MNFELLLVVLTILTALVWGWDKWLREREGVDRSQDPWYIDLPRSLFPIILIVLLLRSFIAEPFRIPSGSMLPTLQAGDFILVNKSAYGIRLPLLRTRLFGEGEPERGEVAVFRYPRDPSQDYIKRVIGLPGDEISYQNRVFYVNGEPLEQSHVGPYQRSDAGGSARVYREQADDNEYRIIHHEEPATGSFTYTVPEGHYFTVGDNRDRSADSRVWGPVSDDYLAGRAMMIWMSWDSEEGGLAWDRIGQRIE